ncbi:MAG: (2Fe-2S)-binding protein [Kofleriaceae bacterium]
MPSPGCRVLAFARDWSPHSSEELRAIRGHLRGLGAELIVVAAHQAWRLRPDDEPYTLGHTAAKELHRDHGSGEDAVIIFDHEARVLFEHRAPAFQILDGLRRATDEMLMPAPITFTRRGWMATCVVAGFSAAVLAACRQKDKPIEPPAVAPPVATNEIDVVLDVNGTKRTLRIEPRVSLLDALRERLELPGTKKGCDAGQCGACTVHINGKRALSCLTLAATAQGKQITTIEGLAKNGELHPVQKAFIAHDGMQCGFCTPGQIMSAVAVIADGKVKTDDDIREQMSGNICRCGAYPNILASIKAAQKAGPA